MKISSATSAVELVLRSAGIKYEREFKFHPSRRWRADVAIPALKILLEIEGGTAGNIVTCNHCHSKVSRRLTNGKHVYVREGGRHNSVAGYTRDCEKYNAAACLGYAVLRYTTAMILSDPLQVVRDIENMVKKKYA